MKALIGNFENVVFGLVKCVNILRMVVQSGFYHLDCFASGHVVMQVDKVYAEGIASVGMTHTWELFHQPPQKAYGILNMHCR